MDGDAVEWSRPAVDGVTGDTAGQAARCHGMLFRLAGHVPDEMLAWCREWLADGLLADVAATVTHWALATGMPMRVDDVALLGQMNNPDGHPHRDWSHIRIESTESGRISMWQYSLVDDPVKGSVLAEELVESVRVAASALVGVRAVWGAWRVPDNGAEWPAAKRVFVAEVEPGSDAVRVTGVLTRALRAAGEEAPQVETCLADEELPYYQATVRRDGVLVYASGPHAVIRRVEVYDEPEADERGPGFHPDHPRLDDEERARVLDYLANGVDVVFINQRDEDVLRPDAGEVVPAGLRTDGRYVWSEATEYYLRHYALAPSRGFLAHIRRCGYELGEVDPLDVSRAKAVVWGPVNDELIALWRSEDPPDGDSGEAGGLGGSAPPRA